MLKKWITFHLAFIVFTQSLIPNSFGILQSGKMTDLYAHFIEHKAEGIGLLDFLWMHYASDSSHKSQKEHQKLPSLDQTFGSIIFPAFFNLLSNFKNSSLKFMNYHEFLYSDLYFFQFQTTLLNPPKFS